MRIVRISLVLLTTIGLAFALTACQEEGAMESAGKAIDGAASDAADAAEDAKDKMKDSME